MRCTGQGMIQRVGHIIYVCMYVYRARYNTEDRIYKGRYDRWPGMIQRAIYDTEGNI